MYLLI
jgi:hypothetical protein